MKAVLYRQIGTMSSEHKNTTIAIDADTLEVQGTEGVVLVKKDSKVLVVVKLGENDYVKLDD